MSTVGSALRAAVLAHPERLQAWKTNGSQEAARALEEHAYGRRAQAPKTKKTNPRRSLRGERGAV